MTPNIFDINPAKVYVYLRVSTRAQVNGSDGLSDQNNICTEYVKKHFKHLPIEYYSEIGSSYNNKNKLTELNKIMRKMIPNSLLLVRDISRLGRDTFQVFSLLRKIKKTDSHIIGIDENLCYNYSRLMDREFSHKIIDSEKSSDQKHNLSKKRISIIKANGGFVGRAQYGTMIVKKENIPYIYKNPFEMSIIELMKTQYKKLKNLTKVTKYLNSINICNRRNVIWTELAISNILKKHYPNILSNPNDNVPSDILSGISDLPKEYEYDNTNMVELEAELEKINLKNTVEQKINLKNKSKK
jgi:DNA invertase Pin-like site-specific DNA recombinase